MYDNSISSAGILMRKQQIAIIALALWLTIVSVFMLPARYLDFYIFFGLFLMGTLVIGHLMQSNYVQPVYQRYISYLTAAGMVILDRKSVV